MTVTEMIEKTGFKALNVSEEAKNREIGKLFCCDLLSIAMSKMPDDAAWVTVMSNMNTLAVASLTDTACIVLAEGVACDREMIKKAEEQEITLLTTEMPVYEAAKLIDGLK